MDDRVTVRQQNKHFDTHPGPQFRPAETLLIKHFLSANGGGGNQGGNGLGEHQGHSPAVHLNLIKNYYDYSCTIYISKIRNLLINELSSRK